MRLAVTVFGLFLITACTPEQWLDLQRQTVDCHHAVDTHWPQSSRSWAHRIVDRESGGDPHAQNRTSSASGCFQLLRMHGWRFEVTGSSWAFRYDARANTIAALHLYTEQGPGPWQ